ncbi:RHS repeat domain-containing protein [Flavobacterium sp. C3NV]|uniref:RHS repeat protein n=1 Tax=Flavobacterium sp. C3NV TaxID=3393358 RepID=UPI0039903573
MISSFFVLGQNNTSPSLPKIISASPEAASLGQYGGVPVNLSTGQINYTIPIYTIKSGDFEYPLTLSYNYNGFKPETDPTMVGMGWTANFSGVVARQMKGVEDEDPYIGYFVRGSKYENLDNLSVAEKVEALKNATDYGHDTRPDKFILNTATINGSFRFKYDKTSVFSEQKNYKATFNGFISIKDDKGILYQFNDLEHTMIMDWTWSSDETDYMSSFMLSKITLPNSNKELNFQYDNYNSIHRYTTNTKTVHTQLGIEPPANGGGYSSNFSLETTESKIIKRIDFPNGYILFDQNIFYRPAYSGLPDPTSVEGTYQVKLRSVSVYNLKNKLIEKFNFDYYDSGYYYYLTSIKKEDSNGSIIDYYNFDYENLQEVPTHKITNNMTDLWGFYSGIPFSEYNVNYSLSPSFSKGIIGALKKITYPTKGTTEITYEPNQIKRVGGDYESSNPKYNALEFVSLSSENNGFDCDQNEKVVNIPYGQTVKITLEVDVTAGKSSATSSFLDSNGQEFYRLYQNNEVNTGPKYYSEEYFRYLEPGNYRLRTHLCEIGVESGNHNAKTTIEYRTTPYVDDPSSSNIEVGGIRIAQTKDCPNHESGNCVTKKYQYIDNSYSLNPLISSGFLVEPSPRFKSAMIRKDVYVATTVMELPNGNILMQNDGGAFSYQTHYETTFNLRPITPLSFLGSHIFYSQVDIINNDESIGKTENYYTNYIKQSFQPFLDLYPDIEFRLGKILKQNLLENNSGAFTSKQTLEYAYNDTEINPSNYVFDCQILRYPMESIAMDKYGTVLKFSRPSDFAIQSIKHTARDFQLNYNSTTTKEKNGTTENVTSYIYDEQTGYPTEVSSLNSENQLVTTKTYYPNNKGSITGLDTFQSQTINNLIDKNIVSIPIQTETFIRNPDGSKSLKNTQRTNFKTWTNNIVLPEFIQAAKSISPLENRIQYHSYYLDGKVKELSTSAGTHIVYIWGYNNEYPIAKIENATYDQISSYVQNLQNRSNTGTEVDLIDALNALRSSLTNAMVSTYTYIPLIGVSTITDPKGDQIRYTYDSFGRLQFIKDAKGNLLSENQYHYKN